SRAEIRRRLSLFRVDITYFGHGIYDEPQGAFATFCRNAHDYDNCGRAELGGRHAEAAAQIDDRHDGAAQIDHAEDVVRRVRNRRAAIPALDSLHLQDRHAVLLATEYEREELLRAL